MIALPSLAHAGRNRNGALVVHTDDAVFYTASANYCNSSLPTDCASLDANGTQGIAQEQVIWLLAAFRPESSPGVTTIEFGISHNLPANQGYFVQWAKCGPSPIEFPDEGWPEIAFGNLVAYGNTVYDHVFKFYWFAVFRDDASNYFGTRTYPSTDEAKFVDDGNPPAEDLIHLFGTVRWDGAGRNDCPQVLPPDACCFPDGSCQDLFADDCAARGGVPEGEGTACATFNCPPHLQLEACCFPDGSCQDLLAADCMAQGGRPEGEDTSCATYNCPQTPGACCFLDGSCQDLMQDQCTAQGGTYQAGQVCENFSCPLPVGACCVYGVCFVVTQDDCSQMDGWFAGVGSNCDDMICTGPTGACCFVDGSCRVVEQWVCNEYQGTYQGDGTPCDPNPCEPTPVQPTTWGRIKTSYR